MNRRSGFTLLEILVAMALVGLVMVGLNSFIFSMSELWGRNTDVRLFEQHVRNVTRFLENELRVAALPPEGRDQQPVLPKEVRDKNGMSDQLLTFELPAGSRLFNWPERPLPAVVCSLVVRDREGLVLLWHSRLEKRFQDGPPRETVVSEFVTSMTYDYYDPDFKRWQTETTLRKEAGDPKPPQRLRLKFTYDKLVRETLVDLPTVGEGLPNF
jgi:prepilin-type N-terminal cleavage/methylation domain-containing protein